MARENRLLRKQLGAKTPPHIRFDLVEDDNNMEEPKTSYKVSRSTKLADPPKFHNEPDRDDVGIEMWFRQIRDKIGVNKDHYPDTADRKSVV